MPTRSFFAIAFLLVPGTRYARRKRFRQREDQHNGTVELREATLGSAHPGFISVLFDPVQRSVNPGQFLSLARQSAQLSLGS
jgi:hypothetical protein